MKSLKNSDVLLYDRRKYARGSYNIEPEHLFLPLLSDNCLVIKKRKC